MYIPFIVLPIVVTLVCLAIMLRPSPDFSGGGDNLGFGLFFEIMAGALRLLWLIPILLVWVIYLGVWAAWKP